MTVMPAATHTRCVGAIDGARSPRPVHNCDSAAGNQSGPLAHQIGEAREPRSDCHRVDPPNRSRATTAPSRCSFCEEGVYVEINGCMAGHWHRTAAGMVECKEKTMREDTTVLSTSGYPCPLCGGWVCPGATHYCPVNPVTTSTPRSPIDYRPQLERIAAALEKNEEAKRLRKRLALETARLDWVIAECNDPTLRPDEIGTRLCAVIAGGRVGRRIYPNPRKSIDRAMEEKGQR